MTRGEWFVLAIWASILISAALLFVIGPIVLPITAGLTVFFWWFDNYQFRKWRKG